MGSLARSSARLGFLVAFGSRPVHRGPPSEHRRAAAWSTIDHSNARKKPQQVPGPWAYDGAYDGIPLEFWSDVAETLKHSVQYHLFLVLPACCCSKTHGEQFTEIQVSCSEPPGCYAPGLCSAGVRSTHAGALWDQFKACFTNHPSWSLHPAAHPRRKSCRV